jgi:hypothetical protein
MGQAGHQVPRILDGDRPDDQMVGHPLGWFIALGSHGRQLYVRVIVPPGRGGAAEASLVCARSMLASQL